MVRANESPYGDRDEDRAGNSGRPQTWGALPVAGYPAAEPAQVVGAVIVLAVILGFVAADRALVRGRPAPFALPLFLLAGTLMNTTLRSGGLRNSQLLRELSM